MSCPSKAVLPISTPSPSLTPDRERQLVARVRLGDTRAFEEIFVAYFGTLCEFARGYGRTPDQAEELVQEVFLRIWQRRSQWQPTSIRAYLIGSVRNSALNQGRHERIVARFEEAAVRDDLTAALGQPPEAPDTHAQASELGDALRRAVHALPERRRQVVVLRWEYQLSQAEIAEALGVSVRTVETQFARAMVSLRRQLAAFRP